MLHMMGGAFLVLDLRFDCLDVFDGFHVKIDHSATEVVDKNLHASSSIKKFEFLLKVQCVLIVSSCYSDKHFLFANFMNLI